MRKPITTALFALLATGITSLFLVQLAWGVFTVP